VKSPLPGLTASSIAANWKAEYLVPTIFSFGLELRMIWLHSSHDALWRRALPLCPRSSANLQASQVILDTPRRDRLGRE